MSFSKPKLKNPATKFIEFKGDKGIYQYWDKEQEKSIELETPAYFIVLDELATIKGFSDKYGSGIYSNEIHYLNDEVLNVRAFKGDISIVGKYAEIKDRIKAVGGKFAKSIYCLHLVKGQEPELVNLQIYGAAFSAWLNFKFNQTANIICLTGETHTEKKGSTVYHVPHFSKRGLDERFVDVAIEEDKKLQEYFKQYKNQAAEKSEVEPEEQEKTDAETWHENTYEQDAPKREKGNESMKADDIPYPPEFQDAPPPEEPPEAAEEDDLPF